MQRAFNNVDFVCAQIGNPEGKGLRGEIQNKDVYHSYIHTDKPIKITLSGKEIKRILERTATALSNQNGEVYYNEEILEPTLMTVWKGFNYTVNINKPIGHRIVMEDVDLESDKYLDLQHQSNVSRIYNLESKIYSGGSDRGQHEVSTQITILK